MSPPLCLCHCVQLPPLPYCGEAALVPCVWSADTSGLPTYGGPCGRHWGWQLNRTPSPCPQRGGGKPGRTHLMSKVGSQCCKFKNSVRPNETLYLLDQFHNRLIWKPDVNLFILSEVYGSRNQTFWISYPEHCLPLVKGPGKLVISIIGKLGIRGFLGKQWNWSKKSRTTSVVCEVCDHVWVTDSFKNLRQSSILS